MLVKSIALITDIFEGGVGRHVSEMAAEWSKETLVLLIIYRDRIVTVNLYQYGKITLSKNLVQDGSFDFLKHLFSLLQVNLLHIHSFFRMSKSLYDFYCQLDIPYVYTLHNYQVICPIMTMLNGPTYCGNEKRLCVCRKCLRKAHRAPWLYTRNNVIDIVEYRNAYKDILERAALVICPSKDAMERLLEYYPQVNAKVLPNPEIIDFSIQNQCHDGDLDTIDLSQNRTIRVGLIGGIGFTKGRNVIDQVIKVVKKRDYKIKFIVFGTIKPPIKHSQYLEVLGRYKESEVYQKIIDKSIDFFWFPPVWPETYSYVLSIPIRLKIPVLGSNLGAIGERILSGKWGAVYPWNSTIDEIVEALRSFDYLKWRQIGNFNIKNTYFPSISEFYNPMTIRVNKLHESDRGKDELLQNVCKYLEKGNNHIPTRLTLYETRVLIASQNNIIGKISVLLHFSVISLFNDIKYAGIKGIIRHIKD